MIAALVLFTASHQMSGAERILEKGAAGLAVGLALGVILAVLSLAWRVLRTPESAKTNEPSGPPPLPWRGPPPLPPGAEAPRATVVDDEPATKQDLIGLENRLVKYMVVQTVIIVGLLFALHQP